MVHIRLQIGLVLDPFTVHPRRRRLQIDLVQGTDLRGVQSQGIQHLSTRTRVGGQVAGGLITAAVDLAELHRRLHCEFIQRIRIILQIHIEVHRIVGRVGFPRHRGAPCIRFLIDLNGVRRKADLYRFLCVGRKQGSIPFIRCTGAKCFLLCCADPLVLLIIIDGQPAVSPHQRDGHCFDLPFNGLRIGVFDQEFQA